jgi:hypothetical protein
MTVPDRWTGRRGARCCLQAIARARQGAHHRRCSNRSSVASLAWHGSYLLHQGQDIRDAPVLGDLPIAETDDVDRLEFDRALGRGDPYEPPLFAKSRSCAGGKQEALSPSLSARYWADGVAGERGGRPGCL